MNTKKITSLICIILGLVLAAFSFNLTPAYGQEEIPGDAERGGKLYTSWDLVTNFTDFNSRQPLWVANGNNPAPERITWRCVTCHGWDYRGSEGRLAYAGVQEEMNSPSLLALMGNPPSEIIAWLNGTNNPDHDFSDMLTLRDMHDLGKFISTALISPNLIAADDNNDVLGTAGVGMEVYRTYCQPCHGVEGEKINFGSTSTPSFLGDLAWANPWRIAHVVRFGHIIGTVPPASTLQIPFSQQIDLIAHLQTLPRARSIASAETQNIDFSTQASTLPLVYGAFAISILIFSAVFITVRRKNR
jgi:thiosulfate dehydrogenase